MLTLWETIQQRRSIRKFVTDDVPDELIRQMLEAARLAPSGSNSQPWRFVIVKDKEVRQELCRLLQGQKLIEEAPIDVVCFADLDRYSPEARRNRWGELVDWGFAPTLSGLHADPVWRERQANQPQPREQMILSAVSNTFIAIEHLLLMATALGLGTCWLGATNNSRLNQLFGLPDNLFSVAVVPVGYPAGQIPPQRPRITFEQMVLKPQVQLAREAMLT